jgi:hypothetical protein
MHRAIQLTVCAIAVIVFSSPAFAKNITYSGSQCHYRGSNQVPGPYALVNYGYGWVYCPVADQFHDGYRADRLYILLFYGGTITDARLCASSLSGFVGCGPQASSYPPAPSGSGLAYPPPSPFPQDAHAYFDVTFGSTSINILTYYSIWWN